MQRTYLFILLSIATFAAGCGRQGNVKDYVPPQEAARQSLSTALEAWKGGKTPDQIGASNPAIQAQDSQWREGQKLTAYEIVGPAPAPSGDQNQWFTVKLTLGSAAPKETTYVVLGKDPIWVFSAENYQKTSGM